MAFFLIFIGTIIFPPILFFGFYIVRPREEAVILSFGKYVGVDKRSGINWRHPIGREIRRVSTQDFSLDIKASTVVDANGNPINTSAVVVYKITQAHKAAIDVNAPHKFVKDQAGAILKRICSKYPYDSPDKTVPCLKNESSHITYELVNKLQEAVNAAGLKIISVQFNDLSYAPEIAQAMLMRQQAQALIDARKMIVKGAVSLVRDSCVQLNKSGIKLSSEYQQQLVTNLLVVLCSGENTQPVVQVQTQGSKKN